MTTKTLEDIAKEYADKPPIIVNIEDFREELKDLLYDVPFLERTHERVIEQNKKAYEDDPNDVLSFSFKTWEEKEKVLRELSTELIEGIKDYKNQDLSIYDDLIDLFIDTSPLTEKWILETCLKTFLPVLTMLAETEIEGIFELSQKYYGYDVASFINGVAVYGRDLDRRKLPKWVLKNYRYMIEEQERLLTRAYAIQTTVIKAVAESKPVIEEPERLEETGNDKRAYTYHDDTAQYSYSELSKALVTQEQRQLNVKENELNLQVLLSGTDESEEKIKKLSPAEKLILDTIIKYFIERKYEFTDRDILRDVYGADDRESGQYTKETDARIDGINKAIEKIRTTMIEIKGVARKKDKFFNSRNPFIDVYNVGMKDKNSNTQYYKINSIPFYYTYITKTGGQFIEYDSKAFTRRIEGVKKTEKAQSLRIYLTEKISNICLGYDTPYISVNEILNLEGITAETRKQKYDTLKTVQTYLDDLRTQYKFKYVEDRRGKILKGYVIKVNTPK